MKLSLPLLLLAFSVLAFGAIIEKVEDRDTNRVTEEGEEDLWKQDVGRDLEKVGQWLQGRYAAKTEEEREELETLNARLKELAADVAEEVYGKDRHEGDGEAAAYGWGKWRRRITGAFKKVAQAVVINKVAGAVGGAIG
ncbi:uncharacterized protein LOC115327964 [Ixodes scapularis]|uniref:uncharacterized protein LOC115327964 n=1 Tax=Ixodes scapularis TaxID=6945 RepID=UPI001A9D8E60|nr:uncharacterized protein LOC115327964 [Ixodes scapularis]